tara:strand:- start:13115 stop:13930 length:816 start_codon:yes stop_codon:yes gene_type:complete
MRINVCCLNCGIYGHTTKVCNFPITSYGLICFKRISGEVKYIMVQKKDTISYTEFLRGKYELNNLGYIIKLFNNMTKYEKSELLSNPFETLWNKLWNHSQTENKFQREFNKSIYKFNKLKNGFNMIRTDRTIQFINLEYIIQNSNNIHEQEWEFPKGRRKLHENDLSCAIREFEEEVGIRERIVIHDSYKQFEEIFQGSNNIRYRNIYYLSQYIGDATLVKFDSSNEQQAKEVRNVKWFSYDAVLNNIKFNDEKKELFKRINTIVHKNYLI